MDHALNYVKMFCAIMALLGVDIPPLEGVVQLRNLMRVCERGSPGKLKEQADRGGQQGWKVG